MATIGDNKCVYNIGRETSTKTSLLMRVNVTGYLILHKFVVGLGIFKEWRGSKGKKNG